MDLYANNLAVAGTTVPDDTYVPAAWQTSDGTGQKLYKGVFRKYCRMCHLAQDPPADFTSYSEFQELASSIGNLVCTTFDMPHAEIPYGGLPVEPTSAGGPPVPTVTSGLWWDATAVSDLNSFLQQQLGSSAPNCNAGMAFVNEIQ